MDRREFLGAGALAAVAGLAAGKVRAAGEIREVGGRTFVAACPDAVGTIPRKPGPWRIMVIGAHPDDADIVCGCLALKLIAKGAKVRFVSVTNGCMGHHRDTPEVTARRRREETLEAARRFGLDGYDIYGEPDCGLVPTLENRRRVAKEIRLFEPDFVITHRTCDYHADHRATGQLVMDAGYLLGVPHWVPEAKAQRRRPVILYMSDAFTVPREFRPDVMIDAEPYFDRWCYGLDAQVSQFYEWLPWDKGVENEIPDRNDVKARNAYILKYWSSRKRRDATRFAAAWRAQYPNRPAPAFMEAYEISEYGRAPTAEDLKIIVGEA